ncbi:MAG TPA: hypothetical protein VJA22_02090 [Patescibacteria group bacterium]|nr:hypothetical protein [Patescibacteria group bacterium]
MGKLTTVEEKYGFIKLDGVTKEDGTPHGLPTPLDIFIHQDDCANALETGTQLIFNVIPDRKREGGYRAMSATELVEPDLIPDDDVAIPGFELALVLPTPPPRMDIAVIKPIRHPILHAKMKDVPTETVAKVLANQPMPEIPKETRIPQNREQVLELLRYYLSILFPTINAFGTDFSVVDPNDTTLDAQVNETVKNYETMGLVAQIPRIQAEVERFKRMRSVLNFLYRENLVRSDTIIPIKYLPDMFTAVPVWYYWESRDEQHNIDETWQIADPQVHPTVRHFCSLFDNQNWADFFQMFNRRVRPLSMYDGDIIPPHLSRRMMEATQLFDFVVIATPYHDAAGRDWEDMNWLRSIDPYVLGFQKEVNFFYVIGRYSDTGTFPLYNELVADTIEFLRANKENLMGFNKINCPYWHTAGKYPWSRQQSRHGLRFGDQLMRFLDDILYAFEQGKLFDWLRGEEIEFPLTSDKNQ